MMKALRKAKYVAMDTEFPGIVYENNIHDQYKNVSNNCNQLKLIQVGLTLKDQDGNLVGENSIWQFNFQFDLQADTYNRSSIELLKNSGLDFDKLKHYGIKHNEFAEKIMASGLICNPNFRWIVFHGSSDFGYLLRLFLGKNLPECQDGFFQALSTYFPKVHDIKLIT